MNALVVIETLTPAVYSDPNGIETILSNLEAKVRAVQTDISTPAGRTAIKSLAHQIARSKTALDDMGKDLVADLKKQTGAVDAERKKVRDRLDALKDEVRKPLDDFESAEKKRCGDHEYAIQAMLSLQHFEFGEPASSAVQERIEALAVLNNRAWQEFASRARAIHSGVFDTLNAKREAAIKREAGEAEAARLRAEQQARDQREREERIAAEAAAKATRDAEAKAAREAQEAAARVAEEQRRADQERSEAIARAEKAERDAKAAAAKAAQDRKEAAEKAERDRRAAAAKAEASRVAAVEAERKRVADAEAKAKAEADRRERDAQHKTKIHTDAAIALMNAGLSKDDAKSAVVAIAKGEVPNIRISY
jgi:colicin import membrane protein